MRWTFLFFVEMVAGTDTSSIAGAAADSPETAFINASSSTIFSPAVCAAALAEAPAFCVSSFRVERFCASVLAVVAARFAARVAASALPLAVFSSAILAATLV